MRKKSLSLIIIICLALQCAAQDKTLFTIDGNPIGSVYFTNECQRLFTYTGNDTAAIDQLLQNYINYCAVAYDAKKKHLDTTKTYRLAMEHQKTYEIFNHIAQSRDTKKIIQEIKKRADYQYHVYEITVNISSISGNDSSLAYRKAESIRSRIENGANFSRVARQVSDNICVNRNGGDLGYVSTMEMPGGFFEDYVIKAPIGELSKPIKSNNAYHIIKVTDKRKAIDSVNITYLAFAKGTKKYNDSIKDLVSNVYNSLKTGANIETLRKKHCDFCPKSETISLKDAAEIFGSDIFKIKENELSNLIETDNCWYIVKLNKNIARIVNDSLYNILQQKFLYDERLQPSIMQFKDSIKKVAGYKKLGTFESLYPYFKDSAIYRGQWQQTDFLHLDEKLFKIDNQTYTVADLAEYIYQNQKPCPPTKASIYITNSYNNFVNEKLINISQNILYKSNAAYRHNIDSASIATLYNLASMHNNFLQIAQDKKAVEKYYNTNINKYTSKYKLQLEIYKAKDPSAVKKNIKEINKYVQKLITQPSNTMFDKVGAGIFARGKNEIADMVTDGFNNGKYTMPKDEIISCKAGEYFVITKILQKPEPTPLSEIYTKVQNDYSQQLNKEYIDGLKSKYKININHETLQQIKNYFSNR